MIAETTVGMIAETTVGMTVVEMMVTNEVAAGVVRDPQDGSAVNLLHDGEVGMKIRIAKKSN
jgi:hypothetical protein